MPRVHFTTCCSALLLLLSGCGSLQFSLPGHAARVHTAAVTLRAGERRLALETPRRLPVPGGFELGLASEDPAIVAVERTEGAFGFARYTLVARRAGTVTLHYVNRYVFPADAADAEQRARLHEASDESFPVSVAP